MRMKILGAVAAIALGMAGPVAAQTSAANPQTSAAQDPVLVTQSLSGQAGSLGEELAEQLNANTVTIVSGNPNGTYLYFAYDMSAVLDNGDSLRVLPIVGKGAAQNTKDLLYLRGIDMGITQSDILRHFNKTGEIGKNIENRLRYITRLYNEEMHVLAGPGIGSIEDLDGKKVNFSDAGSGTQLSSRIVFEALGIEVEEVNMGQADAFEAIRKGDLAATVLFGGKPTGAFARLEGDPQDFKLLEVPYTEPLQGEYLPSKLTHDDYPALIPEGEEVSTIAVGAVLAVFNWARDSDRYRRVAKFTEALFKNFDEFLKKPRHPKWSEVNLAAQLPGWKRFGAAQDMLDQGLRTASSNAQQQEFEQFITSTASIGEAADPDESRREELFRAFMKWRESQGAR